MGNGEWGMGNGEWGMKVHAQGLRPLRNNIVSDEIHAACDKRFCYTRSGAISVKLQKVSREK
jgi:hypothetical protein